MSDEKPSCGKCKAYHTEGGGKGQCRRHSPTPQMIMQQGMLGPEPAIMGMWPGVSSDDWCLEYEHGEPRLLAH
jgi:hypothetical protein